MIKYCLFCMLFFFCLGMTHIAYADCEKGTTRQQYQEDVAKAILSSGAVISEEAAARGRSESQEYAQNIFNNCTRRIMNILNNGWKNIQGLSDLFKVDVFKEVIQKQLEDILLKSCEKIQSDTISIAESVIKRNVGNVQGIIYTVRNKITSPSYLSNQLNIPNRITIQNLYNNTVLP